MLKAEQIPTEVLDAFGNANLSRKPYDECIAAAINAWPGMRLGKYRDVAGPNDRIILPLPQEPKHD